MADEWKRLSEISDWLNNVRKPQWENILIKTAQSYVNAQETVSKALPKGHETEPGWVWSSFNATVKGLLAPIITNPIGAGIAAYYVVNAVKSEKEELPQVPQFSIDPEKYLKFMQFHFNLVFIEASKKILQMQAETRSGETPDIAGVLKSVMRSPFVHEPSGYEKFGTEAAEREIEAGLWAKWLNSLSSDSKLERVARVMQEDDMHNKSGDSRKSDGKFRHMTWQRLKAVGAFERAYKGGIKRRDHADVDDGTPSATYPFWLKVARKYWAENHTPDEYLYVGLVSPAAGRFFRNSMSAYEAQTITERISFYFSPTWSAISGLVKKD